MVKLAKLARDKALTYMFCRQQRFDTAKFATRALMESGKLGNVYHAESRWMRTRWIPWRGGWGVNAKRGGGVLLDLGIHQLDDAWFTMGCPQPVDVSAAMHCAFGHLAKGRKDLSLPYDADDNTVALIRFANGATLSMMVTFATNIVNQDRINTDALVEDRVHWIELQILGSKAGVDVSRRRLIMDKGADAVQVSALPIPTRIAKMRTQIAGQMENFCQSIRSKKDPLNTAEQAVHLMRMLDAIRRSASTGRSVTIPS
jgi:predicted dehydrogenase